MNMYRVLFFAPRSGFRADELMNATFGELVDNDKVEYFKGHYNYKLLPLPFRFLAYLLTTETLIKRFKIPKFIVKYFSKYLYLNDYNFEKGIKYIILVSELATRNTNDLEVFNKKTQGYLKVCYFFDTVVNYSNTKDLIDMWEFDKVLSFSKKDSEKFNFIFYPTPISKVKIIDNPYYDLSYVGEYKPIREKYISKFKYYIGNDDFYVFIPKSRLSTEYSKKWKKHSEYMDIVSKSNCLLEIGRTNDLAPTLRFYEAIIYNKKLITNLNSVKKMPYYNPKYVKVIETVENINPALIKWINKKEDVDYGYRGEFSPNKLINYLIDNFSK